MLLITWDLYATLNLVIIQSAGRGAAGYTECVAYVDKMVKENRSEIVFCLSSHYIYIYIYIRKVSWSTEAESEPKASFSIAIEPRCRERTTTFPGLLHLLLIHTLWCWVLSEEASSTIFESLVGLDLGLNPGLPDH